MSSAIRAIRRPYPHPSQLLPSPPGRHPLHGIPARKCIVPSTYPTSTFTPARTRSTRARRVRHPC
ncbi:hypothetical protein C8Q80DRAFT_1174015 [Daedaleopsis nitida]|nr:hypothetical protein C8Q80DRAFT_1174015 [Daedaleopsis nitida]